MTCTTAQLLLSLVHRISVITKGSALSHNSSTRDTAHMHQKAFRCVTVPGRCLFLSIQYNTTIFIKHMYGNLVDTSTQNLGMSRTLCVVCRAIQCFFFFLQYGYVLNNITCAIAVHTLKCINAYCTV